MNVMNVTKEDMIRYRMCKKKKKNLHRCKYAGVTECAGCEYDLPIDKIEYINQ
jgi:hypothetical protein